MLWPQNLHFLVVNLEIGSSYSYDFHHIFHCQPFSKLQVFSFSLAVITSSSEKVLYDLQETFLANIISEVDYRQMLGQYYYHSCGQAITNRKFSL
jgi:hypothetical protein